MRARAVFLGLTLIAALANVAALIMIMAALDRRGRKTNMFMARLFTGRYLSAYKETTKKGNRKAGSALFPLDRRHHPGPRLCGHRRPFAPGIILGRLMSPRRNFGNGRGRGQEPAARAAISRAARRAMVSR